MILVNIDAITQYILSLTPAITALVGVIVVIAVGVGKVKNAVQGNTDTVERTSKSNNSIVKELLEQNEELKKQNKELKKALIDLNNKIDVIDTIKAIERK